MPAAAASLAPIIDAGQCLYLVGAPAPIVGAATEETLSGAQIDDVCWATRHVGTNETRPNSVQVYFKDDTYYGQVTCHAEAWTGHGFRVGAGATKVTGRIDVSGGLVGTLHDRGWGGGGWSASSDGNRLVVELRLFERDPARLTFELVTETLVFERELTGLEFPVNVRFDSTLSATFRPGFEYSVRLQLKVQMLPFAQLGGVNWTFADFGPPGTGTGAWYDSIEVCLETPDTGISLIESRIELLQLADLEERLYRKECVPSVWLPAANGGRLEEARQLVVDLTDAADASGDPNANTRLARQRVIASDQDVAAGQYQRACRNLSDAL